MNRIKELRKEQDMTQADLAKILQVSSRSVGFYESGDRDPDTDTLRKLSEIFDCSIDYLLCKSTTRNWETEGLAFSASDIDGLTEEDMAAVRLIIEGLKAKHKEKKDMKK